jgi:hypothetical protein
VYTKGGEGLGIEMTEFVVILLPPTLLSDRSLRRSSGGNPPHHFGYPVSTGSSAVRAPTTDAPRIYFYFTDENLYASSNDVEFIGQALW